MNGTIAGAIVTGLCQLDACCFWGTHLVRVAMYLDDIGDLWIQPCILAPVLRFLLLLWTFFFKTTRHMNSLQFQISYNHMVYLYLLTLTEWRLQGLMEFKGKLFTHC